MYSESVVEAVDVEEPSLIPENLKEMIEVDIEFFKPDCNFGSSGYMSDLFENNTEEVMFENIKPTVKSNSGSSRYMSDLFENNIEEVMFKNIKPTTTTIIYESSYLKPSGKWITEEDTKFLGQWLCVDNDDSPLRKYVYISEGSLNEFCSNIERISLEYNQDNDFCNMIDLWNHSKANELMKFERISALNKNTFDLINEATLKMLHIQSENHIYGEAYTDQIRGIFEDSFIKDPGGMYELLWEKYEQDLGRLNKKRIQDRICRDFAKQIERYIVEINTNLRKQELKITRIIMLLEIISYFISKWSE